MPEAATIVWSIPVHQPIAVLAQVAPVQNTWYAVLSTSNVRVIMLETDVGVANETIELEVTIDGIIYTGTQAQVFGTAYTWLISVFGGPFATVANVNVGGAGYDVLYGRAFSVRIRKTTAAGAGTLTCRVLYQRWP